MIDDFAIGPRAGHVRRGPKDHFVGKDLRIDHHRDPLLQFGVIAHRHLRCPGLHDDFRLGWVNPVMPLVVAAEVLQVFLVDRQDLATEFA